MMRLRAMAAGLALAIGAVGVVGCASEYEGYGWNGQPTSPEPKDPSAPAPNGNLTQEQKEQLIESVTAMVRQRAFAAGVDFAKWPDHLKKHQARIDAATNMTQFSGAVNRALNEFGISHIDLMSPRQAQMQHAPKFGGIGITRDQQLTGEGVKIIDIRENSPAAKAGLKVGDLILEVDGKKLAWEDIRGVVGTEVALKIQRAEGGDAEIVKIKRAELSVAQAPRLLKVSDEAAVVRIDSFTDGYDRRVVEKVMKDAAAYPYLVIDLRSNGGGAVTNFIHFLSTLLPRGTEVGTFISKQMVDKYKEEFDVKDGTPDPVKVAEWTDRKVKINRNPVEPYAGKVAVLINGGSASASEIVAAAMRELRESPLVGSKSAGAVLMSTYVKMDNGFEMKVPTSDYVSIKGLRIEGSPLVPDVVTNNRRRGEILSADVKTDKTVAAAIEALRSAAGSHAETGAGEGTINDGK